MMAYVIRVPDL